MSSTEPASGATSQAAAIDGFHVDATVCAYDSSGRLSNSSTAGSPSSSSR